MKETVSDGAREALPCLSIEARTYCLILTGSMSTPVLYHDLGRFISTRNCALGLRLSPSLLLHPLARSSADFIVHLLHEIAYLDQQFSHRQWRN